MMVKIKEQTHRLPDGSIDLESWLQHLASKPHYADNRLIHNACILSQLAGCDHVTESGESCLQQGLAVAEILADLDLPPTALAAAIVYESFQYAELTIDDITEQLGSDVSKLVLGVERMNAIHLMSTHHGTYSHTQIDNIRKMLIAMVDDVQVVLIKLAERLRVLRTVAYLSDSIKYPIAREVMDIYAPLANRLGIGQLKWEMEDLAFRYLEPEKYKEIASGLKARRIERDHYVKELVTTLEEELEKSELKNFRLYGRSKHIHSIYRKMHRKKTDISQIYDTMAVRILVSTLEDCYVALGIVHHLWKNIPGEFDDYITNPKPNGYRSLHTAVIGPEDRTFEVQIRTHAMHDEAELGVAAHWSYKAGIKFDKTRDMQKIDWLREVLAWQQEVTEKDEPAEQIHTEFLEERIYVLTPNGDIIDLPTGATPLDFAYAIHTDVGHRCRGAKINGAIVQLTHKLKTGDRIEILTAKQLRPSRDWLNPHLGYIVTSRAKAKIHHWLKQQNYEENLETGKEIIERELRKLDVTKIDYNELTRKLNYKKSNDVLAALGRGDLTITQIFSKIEPIAPQKQVKKPIPVLQKKPEKPSDISIQGVGNLLTHLAKCCQPVPGDPIVGYITLGRGISIHRKDCLNILNAVPSKHDRLIEVNWGKETAHHYAVNISIKAYDRRNLMHDITALLSSEKANLLSLNVDTNKQEHVKRISLTIETESIAALSHLLDKVKQLPNIIEAKRVTQ